VAKAYASLESMESGIFNILFVKIFFLSSFFGKKFILLIVGVLFDPKLENYFLIFIGTTWGTE